MRNKYAKADRPDKSELNINTSINPKHIALNKAMEGIPKLEGYRSFVTSPDGIPIYGTTSSKYLHIDWDCGPLETNPRNSEKEGVSPTDVILAVIDRLRYIQSTELNYPTNEEALLHLSHAAVILQNKAKTKVELGMSDISKEYSR